MFPMRFENRYKGRAPTAMRQASVVLTLRGAGLKTKEIAKPLGGSRPVDTGALENKLECVEAV